ncbi:MAG: cell wall anchor protein [Bacteroidia bacterium]
MRRKRSFLSFCTALALILITGADVAQQVSAGLDTSAIRIGEQATLVLKVWTDGKHDPVNISWPAITDTILKGIQVLRTFPTDTLAQDKEHPNGELGQARRLILTSFDSGYYAIPPFRIVLNGDTARPYFTQAMLLHVVGMKVDTTLAIKEIKEPLQEPFSWKELIPALRWVALGLVLLVLIIAALRYWLKKKPAEALPPVPKIPPHELALKSLEELKNRKLWQEGKQKEYHSSLTDILRLYIEQRFHIHAMEQTSDEILGSMRSIALPGECRNKLVQILRLADMIKFAKQHALPDENELSMLHAMEFVMESRAGQEQTNTAVS